MPVHYGKAEPSAVEALRAKLRIPRRFREFLLACDPVDLETVTPADCWLPKNVIRAVVTCRHFEFWLPHSRGFVFVVYSHMLPDLSRTTTRWSG